MMRVRSPWDVRVHIRTAGDWNEVDRLCNKDSLRHYRAMHFEIYKQHYLEMIEAGEHQKAFTFLIKRLKPFKSMMASTEFKDLCLLLTCKSVQEVDSFKHWDGANGTTREKLAEKLQATFVHFNISSIGQYANESIGSSSVGLESSRLKVLLKQAATYQVLQSRYQHIDALTPLEHQQKIQTDTPSTEENAQPTPLLPTSTDIDTSHTAQSSVDIASESTTASSLGIGNAVASTSREISNHRNEIAATRAHCRHISTLLSDYESFVIPNRLRSTLLGHTDNVKCIEFIDAQKNLIASGSSDCTVRLWSCHDSAPVGELHGHKSRIWDISASRSGSLLASASADTTVKIWNIADMGVADCTNELNVSQIDSCIRTLTGSTGDVYSCRFHPGENHVVTGGYDMSVRLFDVRNGETVRRFQGHTASVCSVVFNPFGNLIASGSKDNTIKFWDIVSGICIRTLAQHLGEVTSVEMNDTGTLLLSCSKDNSNRLWDMRTSRPVRRFKGHLNTYSNHIRASFGPDQSLVLSGSEDGRVCVWDLASGRIMQRLEGHERTVYQATWSGRQGLMASCSDDKTINLWYYDPQSQASQ